MAINLLTVNSCLVAKWRVTGRHGIGNRYGVYRGCEEQPAGETTDDPAQETYFQCDLGRNERIESLMSYHVVYGDLTFLPFGLL